MPTFSPWPWADATACLMNAMLEASSFQQPVHCSMSNLTHTTRMSVHQRLKGR
jgi:hypothetical protein